MSVTRTERGWGAHLIVAMYCLFRRNTLLERGETRLIVSTVGNYQSPLDKTGATEIGCNRYYETMVFHARKDGPYWDADVSHEVYFKSNHAITHRGVHADAEANDMHEAVVAEITKRLWDGEEFLKPVEVVE